MDTDAADRLAGLLDLYHYLYPENHEAERERFMAAVADGDRYDPEYTYPAFAAAGEAEELVKQVRRSAETPLQERAADWFAGRLRVITSIGSTAITDASRDHYGPLDTETIATARDRFTPGDGMEEKTVSSDTVAAAYRQLFDVLGMDYDVEMVAADTIRNRPSERTILLPEEKQYGQVQAKRLLIHESTHAVRTYNGMQSGHQALVYGTAGHEIVEEGLPSLNEEAVGVFTDTLPRITARVIAINAIEKPFTALYQQMRDLGLDRDTAFIRTYRVKRGLIDTSAAGGFVKDHIYFQGYRRLADADEAVLDTLYAGKIGFDDLEHVDVEPSVTRDEHLAAYREAVTVLAP